MCDCNDNINSVEISNGPQGPQGPKGDTPIITGTSSTSLVLGTGSTVFTTQANIDWVSGQRIRASNSNGTKVMEGPITAYSGTSLTLNIDKVIGTGSNATWNLAICGEVGATGSTGATGSSGPTGSSGSNAYTNVLTSSSLGGNQFSLDVADSTWIGVGQTLFIENSGYFSVVNVPTSTTVTVLNLLYPNNVAVFIAGSKVSPGGIPFLYEKTDGNGVPATAGGAYEFLMRNSGNNGYIFIDGPTLKSYLAGLPQVLSSNGTTNW